MQLSAGYGITGIKTLLSILLLLVFAFTSNQGHLLETYIGPIHSLLKIRYILKHVFSFYKSVFLSHLHAIVTAS